MKLCFSKDYSNQYYQLIIFLTITTKLGVIDNFFHFIDNIDKKEIGIIVAWIVFYFIYMLIFYKTIEIFNQFIYIFQF